MKSPGGSTFPYHYGNGEIHCLKFGGFGRDEARLFVVMEAESAFLRGMPGRRFRVWVDFCETELTRAGLGRFADTMLGLHGQIVRLAVVGCPRGRRRALLRKLKTPVADAAALVAQMFDDPEDAKAWLIGEGNADGGNGA